jgi:hypothetical protein
MRGVGADVITFSCGFGCSLMYGYKPSLIDMVAYDEYLPSVVCAWHTVAVVFDVNNHHHHHLDAATL